MRLSLAALTAVLAIGARAAAAAPAPVPGRIVILGFDGVDAHIVEGMLARRELPNLAALKARGGYAPLTPTVPAQTPVSWATFSTGLDPGGHEIFDFLKRNPANRIPTFAVAEELQVPFVFGTNNPPVFAAASAALLGIPAALLLWRRRRAAGVVLAVAAVAAAVAAFAAAKAWLPAERPWVRNNRRGPVFWAEA